MRLITPQIKIEQSNHFKIIKSKQYDYQYLLQIWKFSVKAKCTILD